MPSAELSVSSRLPNLKLTQSNLAACSRTAFPAIPSSVARRCLLQARVSPSIKLESMASQSPAAAELSLVYCPSTPEGWTSRPKPTPGTAPSRVSHAFCPASHNRIASASHRASINRVLSLCCLADPHSHSLPQSQMSRHHSSIESSYHFLFFAQSIQLRRHQVLLLQTRRSTLCSS